MQAAATVGRMSALMPEERGFLIPAAALLALLLAGVPLWIAGSEPSTRYLGAGEGSAESVPVAPEAPAAPEPPEALIQAEWTVKTFPARIPGSPTTIEKSAIKAEGVVAARTVRAVIDAAILERSDLRDLGGEELGPAVEGALVAARFGAPAGAKDVQITRRIAHIGIDPLTARRATAEISVGFKATVSGKTRRFVQRSTLWLEKTENKWQVVAFTGDRYGVEVKPDKKAKGSDGPSGKTSATKRADG